LALPQIATKTNTDHFLGSPRPAMSALLRIVWYTDPHNIWCWGCEPIIRRLEVLYPDAVELDIRQGGLFEDFGPLRDQLSRMSGGRWKDSVQSLFESVAAQHGMPMAAAAMVESTDDFRSTWPACIAAKAAELQGAALGRTYLRLLREAWCLNGQAIHRPSVQVAVAADAGLDVEAFRAALSEPAPEEAFRRDREECREIGISGFPAFEIHGGDGPFRIEGWRPWDSFDDLLRSQDDALKPQSLKASEKTVLDLLRRFQRMSTREVSAVLGEPDDDAEILLEELEENEKVRRRHVGNGIIWALAA
ncbi:MAG: DsbA family protein, partial [Thermoplasmata archaeon]|nr:DsbA family protein [Thermoplasmata archaeon]